jgi:hypothetical protein
MSRRKNRTKKPHLLSENTVKKFMKLANLGDLSPDFREKMGYAGNSKERDWEQPGLSQYRNHLDLLREQEEAGVEEKVEDIVTAIAGAIEDVTDVPVSVETGAGPEDAGAEVEAGEEADLDAEEPAEAEIEPAEEEPVPEEDEAGLREVVRNAIRGALLQQEELADAEEKSDQLSELEHEDEAGPEGEVSADPPEVAALVDAVVGAIEASTGMSVEAEPAADAGPPPPPGAAAEGELPGSEEEEGDEDVAAKLYEVLQNKKNVRRLAERVMRRIKAESNKATRKSVKKRAPKRTVKSAARRRARRR